MDTTRIWATMGVIIIALITAALLTIAIRATIPNMGITTSTATKRITGIMSLEE